ncbi:hypothetical protein AALA61_16650, partial [Oscillospiraceae bacterium 42-9]
MYHSYQLAGKKFAHPNHVGARNGSSIALALPCLKDAIGPWRAKIPSIYALFRAFQKPSQELCLKSCRFYEGSLRSITSYSSSAIFLISSKSKPQMSAISSRVFCFS